MNYQTDRQRTKKNDRRQKPPPNYYSRPVQYKLLVLVAMIMLVLVMMNEVRKPDNWRWMGFEESQPAVEPAKNDDHSLELVRNEAWAWILQPLDSHHIERINLAMANARGEEPFSVGEKQLWPETLDRLDLGWRKYLQHARAGLEKKQDKQLTATEKKDWLELLNRVEAEWNEKVKPLLHNRFAGDASMPLDPAADWYQAMNFRLSLMEIRDDTPLRNAEKRAWRHFFEILKTHEPEELKAASLGPIGYLPLLKQSDHYRGKPVTIRGEVRGARKEEVFSTSYYAYWVKPLVGPDSPIVVYALELPPGFPEIKENDKNGTMVRLNEKVEFTGFFFKRQSYRATDRRRDAPLVLANAPLWQKQVSVGNDYGAPNLLVIGGIVVLAAMLGLAVAATVYYHSRRQSPSVERIVSAAAPKNFHSLDDAELAPGIEESLRLMEQEENNEP